MSSPIDFYFDFSSPYGYLAAQRIDSLAAEHDRKVHWHPFLLGAALKVTGGQPLVFRDLLREYGPHDLERCARQHNIPYRMPSTFPVPTQAAARTYWWLHERDESAAKALAKTLYSAYFAEDRNISEPEVVLDIAAECGHDRQALAAALQTESVKNRLKDVTGDAIKKGVFGSPYFIVDDEPFWGHDRLEQMAEWLRSGGW